MLPSSRIVTKRMLYSYEFDYIFDYNKFTTGVRFSVTTSYDRARTAERDQRLPTNNRGT